MIEQHTKHAGCMRGRSHVQYRRAIQIDVLHTCTSGEQHGHGVLSLGGDGGVQRRRWLLRRTVHGSGRVREQQPEYRRSIRCRRRVHGRARARRRHRGREAGASGQQCLDNVDMSRFRRQ